MSTNVGVFVILLSLLLVLFKPKIRHFYTVLIGVTFLYSLLTFLIPAGLDFNVGFLPVLEHSFFILPMLMAYDIITNQDRKSALLLIILVSVMFYVVYQATMVVLIEFPNAARLLAQGSNAEQLVEWRDANVGGFAFSYCAAPVGLILFEMGLKSKGLVRVVSIFLCVYLSIFIFLTQYTTLLVFYALGCIFLLYLTIKNRTVKIVLILLGCVVVFFITDILSLIAESTSQGGYNDLAGHFDDFANTSQGEELRSSRNRLAMSALRLWVESPIWGNWAVGLTSSPDYITVMHAHSGVASILASTGIIGLFLHFFFFAIGFRYIRGALIRQNCSPLAFDISFLFLLIVDFINPILTSYEFALMTFLGVPLTIFYFKKYFLLKDGK